MRLYGHPWSINTRKILTVFAEKGHAAELVYVDIPRGEHREPAHLARHPFAKVPVLEDGDFRVHETAAIARYLDETLPGAVLQPDDVRGRARALQWDRVQQSYFEGHAHPLIVHRQFARIIGFPADETVISKGREGMQPALDALNLHLLRSVYVAGEAFGLADITWMPYLDYLLALGEDEAVTHGRPGLRAWWERVRMRPSWRAVAHTGLQPWHPAATAEMVALESRGTWTFMPR